MAIASHRRSFVSLAALLAGVFLCGGCSDLKYSEMFGAGVLGAAVGGIVGHQSDECAAGVGVGIAVFVTGDLLHQIDQINEQKKLEEASEQVAKGDSLLDMMRSEP